MRRDFTVFFEISAACLLFFPPLFFSIQKRPLRRAGGGRILEGVRTPRRNEYGPGVFGFFSIFSAHITLDSTLVLLPGRGSRASALMAQNRLSGREKWDSRVRHGEAKAPLLSRGSNSVGKLIPGGRGSERRRVDRLFVWALRRFRLESGRSRVERVPLPPPPLERGSEHEAAQPRRLESMRAEAGRPSKIYVAD